MSADGRFSHQTARGASVTESTQDDAPLNVEFQVNPHLRPLWLENKVSLLSLVGDVSAKSG